MDLSIIIPAYNEEKNVEALYKRLKNVLEETNKTHEIMFIDDGSTDKTLENLKQIACDDKNIKIVQLRKNFGKAIALSVGWKEATGNLIIQMDSDLQDDPCEIPRFLEAMERYDLVSGWKFKRHDPPTKTIPSKFFNWLTSKMSGVKIHDFNCGFKCYKKEVAENISLYGELHRYIPVLAYRKGFRVGEIKVTHHPRRYGKSKYGASRLLKGFFDLMTISFLSIFEKRPLHLFGSIGFILFSGGFLFGLYILYLRFILKQQLGIGSTLAALLILAGIQIISVGLIGELIVKKSTDEEKKEISNKKYVKEIYEV